ncbi:hypothetical protein N8675_04310, partial [Akkermansiaceae bacterium]|nr:hypothetical protein [Akkermansiaceae bacterium]
LSDKYDHIIRLGHLLDVTGGLDQELERLRKGDSVENSRRYLGYLRVKGDAGLLRKEARRLGDRSAEVIAALVEGDFEPYFKYLLEIGKLGLPVQNYIKWTLADHKGDTEAKKKAYESILSRWIFVFIEKLGRCNARRSTSPFDYWSSFNQKE